MATDVKKATLIPTDDMTNEQRRAAQKARCDKYGIKMLEGKGERVTFPKGFPTSLDDYADPGNLLFPLSPQSRAVNARVRFKQFADNIYGDDTKSKKIVHTRIVEAELGYGSKPKYIDDALDKLLPDATKKRMEGYKEEVASSSEVDTKAVKAKVQKMISFGVEPGDDYEPRLFLTHKEGKSTSAVNVAVKIAKAKLNPEDNMSHDRVSNLLRKMARLNYFLFGPFEPPTYEYDKPQNRICVRHVFPGNICIIENYQAERNWKCSYRITPDAQGFYIAELVGTPIPVELDTLDSFKEVAKVAKSVSGNCVIFGEVSVPITIKESLFSNVLGTPKIEVM